MTRDYLVRHEIIAMHGVGAPQIYPVCFQARLTGSGTAKPADTAKFPAAYDINDMFKTYSIYDGRNDHSQCVPPGPPVYQGGNTPAPSGDTSNPAAAASGPGPAPATSPSTPAAAPAAPIQVSAEAPVPPAPAPSSNTIPAPAGPTGGGSSSAPEGQSSSK
jgi:hypothetical protein